MSAERHRFRGAAAPGADAGRSAGRPRRAARADARQPDRARPGRARVVGALGDARPAQLGRARRPRRSSAPAPGRRSSCCACAAATARAGSSRATCSSSPSARSRTSPTRRGGSCPTAERRAPSGPSSGGADSVIAMAVCYRHPSRETGVSCSSCGRPICPDCMTPTPVGHALPGVLAGSHQGQDAPLDAVGAGGHAGADRDQRARVHRRDGLGRAARLGRRRHRSTCTGALFGPAIAHQHEYWRILTAGFLHEGLAHIFINMLSLYFIGPVLEPAIGRVNFAAIYFASLLAGSFGALLFQPEALHRRRLGRDLRHLRRADRGRPRTRDLDLAERPRAGADAQPAVLGHLQRDLDRRPPRRPDRRADHRLAGGRVRRAPPAAVGRASPAACAIGVLERDRRDRRRRRATGSRRAASASPAERAAGRRLSRARRGRRLAAWIASSSRSGANRSRTSAAAGGSRAASRSAGSSSSSAATAARAAGVAAARRAVR